MNIKKDLGKSFKKGSMMAEVLIVVFVITVSVLAAMGVAQKAIYLSRQASHQSQASFILEEGAEATRIVRDTAWNNISNLFTATDYYLVFSSGTWTFSTTPSQIGVFTRKVVFSQAFRDGSQNLVSSGTPDSQTKLVTVTVSWVEGGQTITKALQFYIADIFS